MNKFSIFLIFFLLSLIIPFQTRAQIDILEMPDDTLFGNPNEEKGIELKSLELYWLTDAYTPFGYQGRTLPTKDSFVDVKADLKITGENPKNLKYSWFIDGNFQEAKSGYGKDSFHFGIRRQATMSHTVLLKVFNEDRSFSIEKSITVPITNPEVVIYAKNESQTILPYVSSAKSFRVISDKESSFLALPYFFNIKSLKDLEFNWILGEKSVKESSLTANVFGLKIVNKQTSGFLKETLEIIAINKLWTNQKAIKNINLDIY